MTHRSIVRPISVTLAAGIAVAAVPACAQNPIGPVTPTGNDTPREEGWKLEEVTRGLMRPWGADWLPGGDVVLVTEKEGRLRVVAGGELSPEPVRGLPDTIFASGQGGLLDVEVHPEFQENRLVYFTASTGTNRANRTELFRARLSEDLTELTDVESVFRNKDDKNGGQHFGSRIMWLPDGSLLLSIGDGGNPPTKLNGDFIRKQAQNENAHLGKILRMDEDGGPMPDTPFAADDDPETDPYVYVLGLRNVQGMSVRPGTGEVWATS
ncbi:MAG: PQQ-dependent sugar dehydrogenase, partial [Planctomycetota bacterium]